MSHTHTIYELLLFIDLYFVLFFKTLAIHIETFYPPPLMILTKKKENALSHFKQNSDDNKNNKEFPEIIV